MSQEAVDGKRQWRRLEREWQTSKKTESYIAYCKACYHANKAIIDSRSRYYIGSTGMVLQVLHWFYRYGSTGTTLVLQLLPVDVFMLRKLLIHGGRVANAFGCNARGHGFAPRRLVRDYQRWSTSMMDRHPRRTAPDRATGSYVTHRKSTFLRW